MLETLEDIAGHWELGALSELSPLCLALEVDVLHPGVMIGSRLVRDVLLEDDNVGVGNGHSIGRGDDGS